MTDLNNSMVKKITYVDLKDLEISPNSAMRQARAGAISNIANPSFYSGKETFAQKEIRLLRKSIKDVVNNNNIGFSNLAKEASGRVNKEKQFKLDADKFNKRQNKKK